MEGSAMTEMQLKARIKATEQATERLKSFLKERIKADRPRRLKLAKRANQTYHQVGASETGPKLSPGKLMHGAMEHLIAVRESIESNATARRVLGRGNETLGGFGITTFVLDGLMGFVALVVPRFRCLPVFILLWYLMGLFTLKFDQGLTWQDSMMMLAQMATTVGYGTATPKSDSMRLFHAFHALLVGQGIDDAISSMFDVPLDVIDNCMFKNAVKALRKKKFSLTQDLRFNIAMKTLDLVFWIAGASAYFAHDFKTHWACNTTSVTKNCTDESFVGRSPVASAIYTALISMTSIGYGDLYPKGTAAKWGSPWLLHSLTTIFKRYSNALGQWNNMELDRSEKDPGNDVEPWHFTMCPLPYSIGMRGNLALPAPGKFHFNTGIPNRFGWLSNLCDNDKPEKLVEEPSVAVATSDHELAPPPEESQSPKTGNNDNTEITAFDDNDLSDIIPFYEDDNLPEISTFSDDDDIRFSDDEREPSVPVNEFLNEMEWSRSSD